MGSLVQPGEPNRALLLTAAQTIQYFVERRSSGETVANTNVPTQQIHASELDEILGNMSADPWNMEIGFWQDLAEYPFLGTPGFPPDLER